MGLSSFGSKPIEEVRRQSKVFFQTYWWAGRTGCCSAPDGPGGRRQGLIITGLDVRAPPDWGARPSRSADFKAMLKFARRHHPSALAAGLPKAAAARPDIPTRPPGGDPPTSSARTGSGWAPPPPGHIKWLRDEWGRPFMSRGSYTGRRPAGGGHRGDPIVSNTAQQPGRHPASIRRAGAWSMRSHQVRCCGRRHPARSDVVKALALGAGGDDRGALPVGHGAAGERGVATCWRSAQRIDEALLAGRPPSTTGAGRPDHPRRTSPGRRPPDRLQPASAQRSVQCGQLSDGSSYGPSGSRSRGQQRATARPPSVISVFGTPRSPSRPAPRWRRCCSWTWARSGSAGGPPGFAANHGSRVAGWPVGLFGVQLGWQLRLVARALPPRGSAWRSHRPAGCRTPRVRVVDRIVMISLFGTTSRWSSCQ